MTLNRDQYGQLLKPLAPSRVAKRSQAGRSLSYLEAWDVKAHLIRIFGFGGWSWTVTEAVCVFEAEKDGKWNVGYKVIGTLTIATLACEYSEAAVGSSTLPQRGEAHDMAVKTAESDALKRAAINLGTQFGLSLYNDGQTKDVVGATLDGPVSPPEGTDVFQAENPTPPQADPVATFTEVDYEGYVVELRAAMNRGDIPEILEIKSELSKNDLLGVVYQGKTMQKIVDLAVVTAGKKVGK